MVLEGLASRRCPGYRRCDAGQVFRSPYYPQDEARPFAARAMRQRGARQRALERFRRANEAKESRVGLMRVAVGVDGCKFGWVAVLEDGGQLGYRLFARLAQLLDAMPTTALVLVDIPIGLPWSACPTRPCDAIARRMLGRRRASSVFPTPSRSASYAANIGEARARNIVEVGRSLSAQAWGICAKVAEVDALLRPVPGVRSRVREVHPEVCFWALNGKQAMAHSKSTRAGRDERLNVLSKYEPRSAALVSKALNEQRRAAVQCDDVLDALAAYVTASAAPDALLALQGEPDRDQHGLPMEMLYT